MDLSMWNFILLACCVLLAAVVVVLAILLGRGRTKPECAPSPEKPADLPGEEKRFLAEIEEGFRREEFRMYLQFIVDNQTKRIASAEALSRWEKPTGEVWLPGRYIGAMERSGLITKLDYYMFERACRKLCAWKDTEFGTLTMSCNFTRLTISEADFVANIRGIAERYDFDRSKLLIEITEDSLEKNMAVATNNILRVKELGFRIALDDVGSGYTDLLNLCEYPIDVVKTDRKILLLANKERGRKLFLGILALARHLNLKVVCEGVETEEQAAMVAASGCDYVQGWYYSRGLPEGEAEDFARAYMEKF